jgi:hypothetical protein
MHVAVSAFQWHFGMCNHLQLRAQLRSNNNMIKAHRIPYYTSAYRLGHQYILHI